MLGGDFSHDTEVVAICVIYPEVVNLGIIRKYDPTSNSFPENAPKSASICIFRFQGSHASPFKIPLSLKVTRFQSSEEDFNEEFCSLDQDKDN